MKNMRKKIIAITLVIVVFAIIFVIPSYSTQDNDKSLIMTEEIFRTNSLIEKRTTETGLHFIEDNYYFLGIPSNNFVNINGENWRIIKINKDNSILIIKEEGINKNKLYQYNEEYNNASFNDSYVKKELEEYYENNLKNMKYVIEQEYCIQYEKECLATEKNTISLLTPEILDINNINEEYNDESFLINNYDYWILSNSYDEIIDSAYSGYVSSLGNLDNGFVDEEKTIRPIITLSKDTRVIGEGTINNPYIPQQ